MRIKKRYGAFLLDVDFSAGNRERVALLGASGSGKTAALRCAAGIDRPDWGYIELDGRVLFDSERGVCLPPQRRRVGYLFQQYALFPHMTVEQNIAAGMRRLEKRRRAGRIAELIRQLRLEGAEKLLPRQLSGGQQQRTALARILASEPEAILLDEPLTALDSYLRWQVEAELRYALNAFAGPVVWVSHDRGEAWRNCGRVCVMDSGKSAPAAGLRALIECPGSVSAARISGCKNLVPAFPGPDAGDVWVPAWSLTLRAAAPWRPGVTTLGIRAECLRLGEGENAFFCKIVQVVEDMSATLAALRPEGAAEDAPPLWMELGREERAALAGRDTVWATVRPEDLLLLE